MKLKKQVFDIPAADGLSQKVDFRRLPLGKSVTALNLLKNKQGRLEKRLGLAALTKTTNGGGSNLFTPTKGLHISNYQGNLMQVCRGTWATGQTSTMLMSYSDDSTQWMLRGPMSEMVVAQDGIVNAGQFSVISPTDVIVGNYRLTAWIATGLNTNTTGTVWWMLTDKITGNIETPPQALDPTVTNARYIRLMLVNNTVVALYSAGASPPFTIYAQTAPVANLPSQPIPWSPGISGGTVLFTTNSGNGAFNACNNPTFVNQFLLLYGKIHGSNSDHTVQAFTNALGAAGSWTVASNVNTSSFYGITADNTTGLVAVTYQSASPPYQVSAALGTISSLTQAVAPTTIYTAGDTNEAVPTDMSIGVVTNATGSFWTVAWSPFNSGFCFRTAPSSSLPVNKPFQNVRIIAIQFKQSGASIVLGQGSTGGSPGVVSRMTYGFYLTSKFLVANGILYCVGWIPSATQGGYVVLAADWATDIDGVAASTNVAWPMRPVAYLQTRTALASFLTSSLTSPNQTFSNANFTVDTDPYATAYVSYTGTSQGNRQMLAQGALQTQAVSGYQSAQWGLLTAFSGGIPTQTDGVNVFEQGFTYSPDGNNTCTSTNAGTGLFVAGGTNAAGVTFTSNTDAVSYIATYEQFDAAGNFHISARSTPFTLTGAMVTNYGFATSYPTPFNLKPTLIIPTLGATMRAYPTAFVFNANTSISPPAGKVTIGLYRTKVNGSTYFRVFDTNFDGQQPASGSGGPPILNGDQTTGQLKADPSANGGSYAQVQDYITDAQLGDGTHPLLYGDGSNGAPGSLDNFTPPASSSIVRHKERLWVARGNQLLYTKQRGELVGPGYQEQVDSIFVGNDDPITGFESMDDAFVVLKGKQAYYVGGDGPGDDGGGNSFSAPQPIPTDAGCLDNRGIKACPEGVYYQSTAGLRLITRGLAVEYRGGPVEDEFNQFPLVTGAVLHPQTNRIYFLAVQSDYNLFGSNQLNGEWIVRDYVLDAWTTGQLVNSGVLTGLISGGVALAPRTINSAAVRIPVIHFLGQDGTVYREKDPAGTAPYFDLTNTYVSTIWITPILRPTGVDQGRFRLWDIVTLIQSADPHGLLMSIAIDYGQFLTSKTWAWQTGTFQIAPGGVITTPGLTQLDSYDGRMGEAFQVEIIDESDPSSVTGQGATLLGLSGSFGVLPGPYKVPPGNKQ